MITPEQIDLALRWWIFACACLQVLITEFNVIVRRST